MMMIMIFGKLGWMPEEKTNKSEPEETAETRDHLVKNAFNQFLGSFLMTQDTKFNTGFWADSGIFLGRLDLPTVPSCHEDEG